MEEEFEVLCDCGNAEEARYFTDGLTEGGINFILNKEDIPVSRYPTKIGRIQILVRNEDFEKANVIYGELTGYDDTDCQEIKIEDKEWEAFVESNKKVEKRKVFYHRWIIIILFGLIIIAMAGLFLIYVAANTGLWH